MRRSPACSGSHRPDALDDQPAPAAGRAGRAHQPPGHQPRASAARRDPSPDRRRAARASSWSDRRRRARHWALAIRRHRLLDLPLDAYDRGPIAYPWSEPAPDPSAEPIAYLRDAIRRRRTILISGGTSTGKTTFLNAMLREIPEASASSWSRTPPNSRLPGDNGVGLIAVKGELGEAKVSANDLLQAALRLRPDRIVLGELRGNRDRQLPARDQHRPSRFVLDRPRQQPARCAGADRADGDADRDRPDAGRNAGICRLGDRHRGPARPDLEGQRGIAAIATRDSHITMVLEDGDSEERRRALKAGADDYMNGPLDARSLAERMARYEAARIVPAPPRARLANGDLTIDLAAHQLRFRGTPVPLRPNEFRLLSHFMEHPDQVFSRTALIERLGKDGEVIDERTVDVWVGRLRRALTAQGAPDPLRTVRALGYVMDSRES
jgi:DNA-binding response OmpR family regulator